MAIAFINGEFLDPVQARVPAMDAGLQHGVGLFETMLGGVRGEHPWAMLLDEHLERLAASARALGLSHDLRTGALADAVLETLRRSGLERARVRLTVTGGDLALLGRGPEGGGGAGAGGAAGGHEPTVLIVAQQATAYPPAMLREGVPAVLAEVRANPLNPMEGHKTLNYWWRLAELQRAAAKRAGEALVFAVTNHLCGGCVSNAFVVRRGVVMTPIAQGEEGLAPGAGEAGAGSDVELEPGVAAPRATAPERRPGAFMPSPVLPGVTRLWATRELAGEGTVVQRQMLTIEDVLGAEEVFLTNSSWGVLPVVKMEASTIGAGAPGPVAEMLMERWAEAVADAAKYGR